MEILKLLVSLFSGGACGALINEFLHRRRARMQPIPLIERVNRLVSSELEGFVLARRAGTEGEGSDLEAVEQVREYQFTLKNSSYIHLHNAEIQFEFPSKDVEGRAERPGRSKTTPVQLQSEISDPWKAGYRWRIPELPPGDSMEFTFRTVDPSSAEYEVALYNSGQVIVEKSRGEPAGRGLDFTLGQTALNAFAVVCVMFFVFTIYKGVSELPREKTTVVTSGGCSLNFSTSFRPMHSGFFSFSQSGPWSVDLSIINTGARTCYLRWDSSSGNGFTIAAGESAFQAENALAGEGYTSTKPTLVPVGFLFGPDSPKIHSTVVLYLRGNP